MDVGEILAAAAAAAAAFSCIASLDEVCRILASGTNVVTTAFLFHPRSLPADDLARLEAACVSGDSSVHGTGLDPGNLSGVLPLALSGMSRTIERITLQERADWSFYESTHITFDNMRFGRAPEEVTEATSDFAVQQRDLPGDGRLAGQGPGCRPRRDHLLGRAGVGRDGSRHLRDQVGRRDSLRAAMALAGLRAGDTLIEIETLWTVGGEYPDHWPDRCFMDGR